MGQAKIDTGRKSGVSTDAQEQIRELKRDNAEPRRVSEVLRRRHLFRSGARLAYAGMSACVDMFEDRFGAEPIRCVLGAADRELITSRSHRVVKARPSNLRLR
ncbi:hypothetical protein cu1595 [Corynebacterium urealyticum DSM 7109]|uniref:Uncharacterized protein n=1 Tax=Corynebacterium urealyticum (strain ATCC 43042 / DSM 7109) TaxID=504474 RepID=B1VIH1_CORU7|nr:hypothetical protein cu1595 [Corynebacterium urealyticum DSM 7109]